MGDVLTKLASADDRKTVVRGYGAAYVFGVETNKGPTNARNY